MNRIKQAYNCIVENWLDAVVLWVLIVFFTYLCAGYETAELGDSFQYLNHQPMRDPVYSLILQLLMLMFGDGYLLVLRILQNLVSAICIYYGYKSFGRTLKLPMLFRAATGLLLLVPHIITPLISQSHMIITNSILTEGFALALYYMLFAWFVEIIVNANEKADIKLFAKLAVKSLLLALILSMIRGQMIVCLVMWMIVVVYACIALKQYKKIILSISALLLAVIFKSVFTGCYNYLENGFYTSTISTSPMMLANVVYVTQPEDLPQEKGDDLLECYRSIVTEAGQAGLLKYDSHAGLLKNALNHEQVHEEINFTQIENNVRELVYNRYGLDAENYYAMRIECEKVCKEMTKTYVTYVAGKYLYNYISMAFLGLVRSVAVEKAGLWIYAILIYMVAIVLTFAGLHRNKRCAASYVMLAVLICIGGTVCGTCLAIQCISRYMMYNLPLFYIAGMALITSLRKENE